MNKRQFRRQSKKGQGMTHHYPEAFKIMQYQCEKCGEIELIWNGRDGVTPFTIQSKCCGYFASHINWFNDVYKPHHNPQSGERVFWGDSDKPKLKVIP
jgi:hypothetical protein